MQHQFDKKYEGTNPVLPGRREVLIAGMGVLAAPLLTSTANAPDALVNVGAMESFQCVIASDWCSAGGVSRLGDRRHRRNSGSRGLVQYGTSRRMSS